MPCPVPTRPQPPAFNRAALVPGLLGAIVLLAGLALVGGEWYLYVRYAVSILALILCVFAGQAKQWWWFAGLIPIAVVWNPGLAASRSTTSCCGASHSSRRRRLRRRRGHDQGPRRPASLTSPGVAVESVVSRRVLA